MTYRPAAHLAFRTRQYERKRWGQVFRIRRDRLGPTYQLRDEAKVTDTLTRWFTRSLSRLGYVSGRADVQVSLSELHRDLYFISGVANVFDDFREEHRTMLADLVDAPRAQVVQVAEPADLT